MAVAVPLAETALGELRDALGIAFLRRVAKRRDVGRPMARDPVTGTGQDPALRMERARARGAGGSQRSQIRREPGSRHLVARWPGRQPVLLATHQARAGRTRPLPGSHPAMRVSRGDTITPRRGPRHVSAAWPRGRERQPAGWLRLGPLAITVQSEWSVEARAA